VIHIICTLHYKIWYKKQTKKLLYGNWVSRNEKICRLLVLPLELQVSYQFSNPGYQKNTLSPKYFSPKYSLARYPDFYANKWFSQIHCVVYMGYFAIAMHGLIPVWNHTHVSWYHSRTCICTEVSETQPLALITFS